MRVRWRRNGVHSGRPCFRLSILAENARGWNKGHSQLTTFAFASWQFMKCEAVRFNGDRVRVRDIRGAVL
jgi:hypothetical protein